MPDKERIRAMFDDIATAYDRFNHVSSFNADKRWRRKAVRCIADTRSSIDVLDIATGTGDMAIDVCLNVPAGSHITGIDLSEGMLSVGREKVEALHLTEAITLMQGDAEALPFPDNSFDRVCTSFGIRNFEHIEKGLSEMYRVLRPGGKLVILELSYPDNPLVNFFFKLYSKKVLPRIGKRMEGNESPFHYLHNSIQRFPKPPVFVPMIERSGFFKVEAHSFTFGVCRMYVAQKRDESLITRKKTSRYAVWKRYFSIWRHTGNRPFATQNRKILPETECQNCGTLLSTPFCPNCGTEHPLQGKGSFFQGTFDDIPFANGNAMNTLKGLLLRPGYMIRDYLHGRRRQYLAPMTALILFYAFYVLLTGFFPTPPGKEKPFWRTLYEDEFHYEVQTDGGIRSDTTAMDALSERLIPLFRETVKWTHLDQLPEEANTPFRRFVANAENLYHSKGIDLFLIHFLLITIAVWLIFKKKEKFTFSASATTAAFIVCQFCFFHMFFLFANGNSDHDLGICLLCAILAVDFHELFGYKWKKSIWKAIQTGIVYVGIITFLVVLILLFIVLFTKDIWLHNVQIH